MPESYELPHENLSLSLSLSLSLVFVFEESRFVAWKEKRKGKKKRKKERKKSTSRKYSLARSRYGSNRPRVTASFPLRVLPKTTKSLFSALSTISLSLSLFLLLSLSPSLPLSPFARTYDRTYQYADHETWSKPLSPRPSLLPPRSKLASLFPPTMSFSLVSRSLSLATPRAPIAASSSLHLPPSPPPFRSSSPKRNVGCFEESVSSVIPKRY